jgi:hypothetical protein
MASYLWVRGQTWFFQLRPPSDLKPFLGSTPFRVRLLVQTRREASRCARHLAGLAERWFSEMRYRGFTKLRVHSDEGDELGPTRTTSNRKLPRDGDSWRYC